MEGSHQPGDGESLWGSWGSDEEIDLDTMWVSKITLINSWSNH